MDNYINENPPHDLNFSEITNVSRKCKFVRKKGRVYKGRALYNGKYYIVFGILTNKNFILKTCYYNEFEK